MVSDDLRRLFENMKDQQTKVRIWTFTRFSQTGYINDVREDDLTLRKNRNGEGFDSIIVLITIAVVDTKMIFK